MAKVLPRLWVLHRATWSRECVSAPMGGFARSASPKPNLALAFPQSSLRTNRKLTQAFAKADCCDASASNHRSNAANAGG